MTSDAEEEPSIPLSPEEEIAWKLCENEDVREEIELKSLDRHCRVEGCKQLLKRWGMEP